MSTNKKFILFSDIKDNKGLTSSVIIPYIIVLMPVIQMVIFLLSYLVLREDPFIIGHLNSSYILALPVFLFIFSITDIPKVIKYKKSRNPNERFRLSRYPELIFLTLTLAYMILASFIHKSPYSDWSIVIASGNENSAQLVESLYCFIYYAICFVFSFLLNSKKTIKHILYTFLAVSIVCGIYVLLDPMNKSIFAQTNCPWAGLFVNSNHYGYYLCLIVTFSACLYFNSNKLSVKIFASIIFIFNSIISFFNNTLGSMLAILIALIILPIIYSIHRKKFNWQYLLPLIIFISLSFIVLPINNYLGFGFWYTSFSEQLLNLFNEIISIFKAPTSSENNSAGTGRWELWIISIREILAHPLFGGGDYLYKPHNEYLQLAQHSGIPTVVFYLTALVIILVKAIKNFRALSKTTLALLLTTFTYLVSAIFGNTMPHTMPFYMLILAFTIRLLNTDIKNKTNNTNSSEIDNINISESSTRELNIQDDTNNNINDTPSNTNIALDNSNNSNEETTTNTESN